MLASRCINRLNPLATIVPAPVPPISVGELAGAEDLPDGDVEDVLAPEAEALGHREHLLSTPICHDSLAGS